MNARRGTILLLALSLLVSGSLVAQTRKENIDLLAIAPILKRMAIGEGLPAESGQTEHRLGLQ